MFDFLEEKKEKYYRKAEDMLKEAGIPLEIDRKQFMVIKNEMVRVYLKIWYRKSLKVDELRRLKEQDGFHIIRDRYTKKQKGKEKLESEMGYFLFDLDEEDR